MSNYKVAEGWNVALGSLITIDPQPYSEGVKSVQRVYALSGDPIDYGNYITLNWDFLESPTEVADVYEFFGLDTLTSSPVTIYLPNDIYVYKRYNGLAVRPQPSWNNYFPRGVAIVVKNLEILA